MVYIYKYTNIENNKVYIGSTINTELRRKQHVFDSNTKDNLFYRAVRKYGWDKFKFEIIEECCPLLRILREQFYIDQYNSFGENGYNSCTANFSIKSKESLKRAGDKLRGQKRGSPSEETRRRLSQAKMGIGKGIPLSEEHKRKLSEAFKNSELVQLRVHMWHESHKGIPLSEEHRRKISESHRGEVFSDERKKNISDGCKKSEKGKINRKKIADKQRGVPLSEEHRRKVSEGLKGKRKGIKFSDDHKKRLSEARKEYLHKKKLGLV